MKKFLATAILAAAALSLPLAASAGEVHNRIHNEQGRIDQGVGSGQLTNREYDHLDNRLDRINAQRAADLRRDGTGRLTSRQYHQLNREENGLSDQIYFDKHNLRRQPGAPRI